MILLAAALTQLLHAALVLAAAPALAGLVRWLPARLAGRAGPLPLQPYRDLARLFRKQPVLAENASWLVAAAPVVSLAAKLGAALLVPTFARGMLLAPLADLLVIAGLLVLDRTVLALAAMDAGTAFGGLGASRLTTNLVFARPALLLVILAVALLAGSSNLDAVAGVMRDAGGLRLSLALAAPALTAVAVALAGRWPADDPNGLSEPAMGRAALLLDYSGPQIALLDYAAALGLLLWMNLLAALFLPVGLAPPGAGPAAWAMGLLAWVGKIGLMALGLALLEVTTARLPAFRVPELLLAASLLGLLAVLLLLAAERLA